MNKPKTMGLSHYFFIQVFLKITKYRKIGVIE